MATVDHNEVLHYLFESITKVKILKFLFRNYPEQFRLHEIAQMVRDAPRNTERELKKLIAAGLVQTKIVRVKSKR